LQVDANPQTTYTFDGANRETTSSAGNIDYDTEGRLTARPGQILVWDDLGRLTQVKNSSTQTVITAYTYDALDRLLVVTPQTGNAYRFRYVGLTTSVAQIVDQVSSSSLYKLANGWDGERLLEWTTTSQTFYGTNGHHDLTWIAGSTGAVSATLRYDPWGNLTASWGSYLPSFRFQGSWFDPTVELSWVVARWYAPGLGRFISEDSLLGHIVEPAGRHLYAYVHSEPVGLWDPLGHRPDDGTHTGGFWYRMIAADSVYTLARRYLGNHTQWPAIFNRNRDTFRWPGELHAGACIYIPATSGWNTDSCPRAPRTITGLQFEEYWKPATRRLKIDWWMLTQTSLNDLTERETGFKNAGPMGQYVSNLRYHRDIAKGAIWWGDWHGGAMGDINFTDRYWSVVGNGEFPPPPNRAMTVGPVIFFDSRDSSQDVFTVRHEYIHIMQYAANRNFETDYDNETASRNGNTGPGHKYEAIAYLWEAWLRNYWWYGGPIQDPMARWKTPTTDAIGWTTPQ
jgi:RHS repeat-associated protein